MGLEQNTAQESEVVDKASTEQVVHGNEDHSTQPEADHLEGNDSPDDDKFEDEKVESKFQERLARSERKIEQRLRQKYSANNQNTQYGYNMNQPSYNQGQHPGFGAHQQQNLSPEQVEANQLTAWVKSQAAEVIRQETLRQKEQQFQEKISDESYKDPDFDDFVRHDMPHTCTPMMVEAAKLLNDPRILYEFSKQNPAEFKKLANMQPFDLAVKLGEFKGRKSVPTRKLQSSAPKPIQEPIPSSTTSRKQSNSVRDRLDQRRAARRSR